MLNRGSPNLVRNWAHAPPTWLTVADPPLNADPTLEHLDTGEAAVILLALDCKASLVLMDDRAGASAARSHGLTVTGTVGVLDRAASRGMTDLPAAVARLRETNFRYRPALLNELLARH